jgi:type IV pilus assembly protein PilV
MSTAPTPVTTKVEVHSARGFTLVEVLVSMLILSIGLLGIAGLQARSIRDNHNAYLRGQAATLAHEMADRLRANREALISNSAVYDLAISASAPTGATNCASSTATCSTADLAGYDQSDWINRISAVLPLGDGSISCNTSRVCTITVAWDENRNGTRDDLDTAASASTSFDSFGVFTVSTQL